MHQFIVVDIEATCFAGKKSKEMNKNTEIIQIGAVKVDHQFEYIDEFSSFVQPTVYPKLSQFCKKLTGIAQDDVDQAYNFEFVGKWFHDWSKSDHLNQYYFSWSNSDPFFFRLEVKNKKVLHEEIGYFKTRWLNLQKIFDVYYNPTNQQQSVFSACEMLGIDLQGRKHNALDDATNTTKILQAIKDRVNWNYVLSHRKEFV